jgi:oligopeptidase A
MPSYIAAMSHLPDRDLREKIYRASLTRASEIGDGDKNNIPLIYEILKIKQEMAKLLGFENYAEQSLARKMAPSVESVRELSDLILEKALPAAEKEMAEILALARETGGDEYSEANMEKLAPWDLTYWSERLKESKFDLTEEELRPYFALPAVLDGMFGLVKRIFNIEVRPADGQAEVWNDDVMFFNVHDVDSGKHIASFYLDPYSRPENKRGGAWMDVCIGKSKAVKRDIPVAYLTCNGSPPVGDKPSLMTFREVETLFHEFGHGLQHMLTTAEEGDVAGINGVEWDAVELPSQFMENWCYDRPTIYGFAKHYATGEPLPEDMFNKLCEQKTFNAGMMACRQLLFGQLDMELHSNFDPVAAEKGEGESIFDVQRRMAEKYSPYNMPIDEDRFLCAFNHIFGGGYAAGYYSYKWAEVMSADAFGAFEDVGLDNEEEVKKVGRKFRETVLSLGGGVPPMDVFKEFRGREPNPEALLRHNGLA